MRRAYLLSLLGATLTLGASVGAAGATVRTYLVSPTTAPQKTLFRYRVEESQSRGRSQLVEMLEVKGRPAIRRGSVSLDGAGRLLELTSPQFPGVTFVRKGGALVFTGHHRRLAHRTRLVLPAQTIVFQQASILGLELAVRHLAASGALSGFAGLRSIPYVYPRTMTLTTLYVLHAGQQTLRIGAKAVTVQRLHVFSPAGGALLFVHGRELVRAEVPLAGIWIRRPDSELLVTPPAPPLSGVERQEVTVTSGDAKLAGTLTLPLGSKGRLPALLFLSGSGPQDRNEDAPGLPIRVFHALAQRLTPMGFVVLRVDDRGTGKSTGVFANQSRDVFTSDGIAMLDFLRRHPRVDPRRIWILGHSEGTLHAARIAARRPKDVAGVIALGAMGLQFVDTYFMQNIIFGEGGLEEALQSAGLMFALRRALVSPKPLATSLAEELKIYPELAKFVRNERYWKGALVYDGWAIWSRVRCPILFVTGGLDAQVPPDHARYSAKAARSAGNRDVTVVILADLDHIFRRAVFGFMGEYANRFRPLDRRVLETVATYLQGRLR